MGFRFPIVITLLLVGLLGACAETAPDADAVATTTPATTAAPLTTLPPPTGPASTTGVPDADLPATTSAPESDHDRTRPPAEVEPFVDLETLTDALMTAETALADPTTPPEDVSGWAWVQQQAYRDLIGEPDWQRTVRRQLPAELRPAFDLNIEAGTQLSRPNTKLEGLPDWRIVAPPPVDELMEYYTETENEFDVPWRILAAIHFVETRFGRIIGDSYAGAQGPMQFMPSTWDAYGEGDVTDPGDAILAAGRYLAANGAPDDMRRALYAYNNAEWYVDAILAYAKAMERYDHYIHVYHQWRVYYRTVDGTVVLEEGYGT